MWPSYGLLVSVKLLMVIIYNLIQCPSNELCLYECYILIGIYLYHPRFLLTRNFLNQGLILEIIFKCISCDHDSIHFCVELEMDLHIQ